MEGPEFPPQRGKMTQLEIRGENASSSFSELILSRLEAQERRATGSPLKNNDELWEGLQRIKNQVPEHILSEAGSHPFLAKALLKHFEIFAVNGGDELTLRWVNAVAEELLLWREGSAIGYEDIDTQLIKVAFEKGIIRKCELPGLFTNSPLYCAFLTRARGSGLIR